MLKDRYLELVDRQKWLPVTLLLILGCALRLCLCGALPVGLNQDEASAGYDAWALLTSGIDRCGKAWPVLLTAWGSGQNALMSYLAIPGIALFGLSEWTVRLPNALCGCLTLWVFWRLAERVRGARFGVTALFLLALNPWHVMACRWGLESNLLPCFLLLGIWFAVLARERPWMLVAAAGAFGLALYAYGTAFFFLPLFLICAVLWLRRDLRPAPFVVALALFALLAAPVALAQAISAFGWDEMRVLGLTLPKLTEGRQAATSVFGGGGLSAAAENFRGFLRILWTQSDGLVWNALPLRKGGLFYFFGLPTAVIGLVGSILNRRDRPDEAPLRFAVYSGLVCALLISGNVNRLNLFWLPLIYFSAVGVHAVLARLGSWAALPAAGVLACCLVFSAAYVRTFGGRGNVNFFPGLGDAIRYTKSLDAETVYVTPTVNQPYIFALFYGEVPPEDFAASVEYQDENAAFRRVLRFDGWEFAEAERADVRIYWHGQQSGEIVADFGYLYVCVPEGSP